MALITINGARQLGIDARVGSIEVGKDADVVLWTGHPLSVYSTVVTTFIEGEIFFDRERDQAMRRDLAAERETLEAAEPNQLPARGGGRNAPPAATPGEDHR
jgi:cytosine/adenosine deaminase-related metal-dependent hydrolase